MPVLIGYVGAKGKLDAQAWELYAILFLWQFPQFMAIAWMYRADYARAGYQVLTARSEKAWFMRWQNVLPAFILVPVTVAPTVLRRANPVFAPDFAEPQCSNRSMPSRRRRRFGFGSVLQPGIAIRLAPRLFFPNPKMTNTGATTPWRFISRRNKSADFERSSTEGLTNPLRKLSRLPWGDNDQKWYLSPVEKRVGFNFTCAPTGAVPINPWASTLSHICLTSTNKLHFLGRRYSAPACRTNPKLFRT